MKTQEGDLRFLAAALGAEELTARDARLLGMVPAGIDVMVDIQPFGGGTSVCLLSAEAPEFWSMQAIIGNRQDAPRMLVNMSIGMLAGKGDGLGTKLFVEQAHAAQRVGIEKIALTAAGQAGSWMNGYYTWPRLGFDGRIPDSVWRKMPPELREIATKERSVRRLVFNPFGRQWWKDNGRTIDLSFDCRCQSVSLDTLEIYCSERGIEYGPAQ